MVSSLKTTTSSFFAEIPQSNISLVGAAEGELVGASEGELVGAAEGELVGAAEGELVGAAKGAWVESHWDWQQESQ